MIYGYCRISTGKQNIERQVRNILAAYPSAVIIREVFTGTSSERKELDKLLSSVRTGDTIVFDSVSRMSRNATEGTELYMKLFGNGIELVFLKEHYIDTATYRQAIRNSIQTVGNDIADIYIEATNKVLMLLAEQQIIQAFDQAEKEVADLHQRTREGIATARLNGKQIGLQKGRILVTKKSIEAKEVILRHSKYFNGTLADKECMKLAGISRNTFYKYKAELAKEQNISSSAPHENR